MENNTGMALITLACVNEDSINFEEWCLLGCYAVKTSNLRLILLKAGIGA
jgi:hypothetical protein